MALQQPRYFVYECVFFQGKIFLVAYLEMYTFFFFSAACANFSHCTTVMRGSLTFVLDAWRSTDYIISGVYWSKSLRLEFFAKLWHSFVTGQPLVKQELLSFLLNFSSLVWIRHGVIVIVNTVFWVIVIAIDWTD